jgi:undecaprenyl diphosphate synthase
MKFSDIPFPPTCSGESLTAGNCVPAHVGIIMDGNGRWAKRRLMPRIFGHKRGADSVREVVTAAAEAGVKVLTLFAFSEENWGRPATEVSGLMGLFDTYLAKETAELKRQNIRLRTMGELERLPANTRRLLSSATLDLNSGTGMVLNLAVSYGARSEIIQAVRQIAQMIREGIIDPSHVDESLLSARMQSVGLPDLDFLIRTSGEQRLSNFMLWQASYAELYFTDVLWPDFGRIHFLKALDEYASRNRRFGLVSERETDGPSGSTVVADSGMNPLGDSPC